MADSELARVGAAELAPSAQAFLEDVAHLAVVEPPPPPVHLAWSAVQEDVRAIEKTSENVTQKFMFRGYEDVLNVVGPILRKHGVLVMPRAVKMTTERYQTMSGTAMRNATVEMAYTVIGPAGDILEGSSYGEAADAGDKAVSKAQSVAYRVFLTQSLSIPTRELDPDTHSHERFVRGPHAQETLDELGALLNELGIEHRAARVAFYRKNLFDLLSCDDPDMIRELIDWYRAQSGPHDGGQPDDDPPGHGDYP